MNPVKPTTALTINGVDFELLFDFEAIAVAEEIVDRPLLTGLRDRDIKSPTISLVRAMLYACLLFNHPKLTYPEAKALVTRKNLWQIWGTVLNAWTAAMVEPDPEEDAVDADPQQDQE